MFIDIDYKKDKNKVQIHLAKPNKEIIQHLSTAQDRNIVLNMDVLNEISFSIPYTISNNATFGHNKEVDNIGEKMLLRLTLGNQEVWFIIDSIDDEGSDGSYMKINAISSGYQLSHTRIGYFSDEAISCQDLLAIALEDTPWYVGEIDYKFVGMFRSFEFTSSNALDMVIQAAETFGAIIEWDTVNNRVNFRDVELIGSYKGVSVDYGRLIKSISRNRNVDEMVTRLYIYGHDDISIHSLNPTGQPYIEDFSFFMYPFERDENKKVLVKSKYMSDRLCNAILDHIDMINERAEEIKVLVTMSLEKNSEIVFSEVRLNELNNQLNAIEYRLDSAKAVENSSLISSIKIELNEKNAEVDVEKLKLESLKEEYVLINFELESLRSEILLDSNFDNELINELKPYIIGKEWKDDRYIDEEELYHDGLKKFTELREPRIEVTVDIENILEIMEEQIFWDRLIVGDMININYPQMGMSYMSRIIKISYDIDGGNIAISIASTEKTKNDVDKIKDILATSQSSSTILENNKHKWGMITQLESELGKYINSEWDANKNQISAGVNNDITIGKRGIIIRNPDRPNEIIVIQSGIIALSEDGGDTWKTAIKPDGIIAERLVGKVIMGHKLIIEDEKGVIRLTGSLQEIFDDKGDVRVEIGRYEEDKYGMRIQSGSLEIIGGLNASQISPELYDEFSYDDSELRADLRLTSALPSSLTLNSNGITATTPNSSVFARLDYRGIYSQGGAIDLRTSASSNRGIVFNGSGISGYNGSGTRTFYLDTNGNLTANNGTFGGNLNGATGTFTGTLSGGHINGSSIDTRESIKVGKDIHMRADFSSNSGIYFDTPDGAFNAYIRKSVSSLNIRNNEGYIDFETPARFDSLTVEGTSNFYNTVSFSQTRFDSTATFNSQVNFGNAYVYGLSISASDISGLSSASVNYASSSGNANYATNAGNASTLGGNSASAFSLSGHSHPGNQYVKPYTGQSIELWISGNKLRVYTGSRYQEFTATSSG